MKWSGFMKTKSKRFVNLATLCLALLGTTLLMAHPVKAEVKSKREYMTRYWEGGSDKYPAYLEARYKGYVEGYNKGLEGHDMPERDNIKVPGDVQLSYDTDYRDGYEEGFGEGAHKHSPLEAEASPDTEGQTGGPSSKEGTTHDEKSQTDESPGGEDATDGKEISDIIIEIITEVISWFYNLF
ncbi:hypothetical protein ETT70_01875 [Streptococcus pyogenes]|nr:hypothetical protein ETT70_01875 [Streptococcus pyogenes]